MFLFPGHSNLGSFIPILLCPSVFVDKAFLVRIDDDLVDADLGSADWNLTSDVVDPHGPPESMENSSDALILYQSAGSLAETGEGGPLLAIMFALGRGASLLAQALIKAVKLAISKTYSWVKNAGTTGKTCFNSIVNNSIDKAACWKTVENAGTVAFAVATVACIATPCAAVVGAGLLGGVAYEVGALMIAKAGWTAAKFAVQSAINPKKSAKEKTWSVFTVVVSCGGVAVDILSPIPVIDGKTVGSIMHSVAQNPCDVNPDWCSSLSSKEGEEVIDYEAVREKPIQARITHVLAQCKMIQATGSNLSSIIIDPDMLTDIGLRWRTNSLFDHGFLSNGSKVLDDVYREDETPSISCQNIVEFGGRTEDVRLALRNYEHGVFEWTNWVSQAYQRRLGELHMNPGKLLEKTNGRKTIIDIVNSCGYALQAQGNWMGANARRGMSGSVEQHPMVPEWKTRRVVAYGSGYVTYTVTGVVEDELKKRYLDSDSKGEAYWREKMSLPIAFPMYIAYSLPEFGYNKIDVLMKCNSRIQQQPYHLWDNMQSHYDGEVVKTCGDYEVRFSNAGGDHLHVAKVHLTCTN